MCSGVQVTFSPCLFHGLDCLHWYIENVNYAEFG